MAQSTETADTVPLQSAKVRSRSVVPSGVRLGSLPADSEDDLRFVQERIALLAKITFLISLMFLLATTLADLNAEVVRYSSLSRESHIVGTVIALALWRITRVRRSLSPRALQTCDVVGILGICWSFEAMGHYALQPYGFYTGLLAVTHVSISRAMIVPSMAKRTLLITAMGFAGVIISRATMPWPGELLDIVGPRSRGILEAVLWSVAGSAVATVASTVIYGLHEKAREARKLGQYALEEKIGEGGMGEVFRARHAMLRRPTAVKLLAGDGSEEQLRRFEKEVQLTAKLTHPNTISIYDYGRTPDGVFYYAMELLDGFTLEELVERHGPQPAGRVIHLLLQACGALKEAHGIGLIHRDIKPANIYLCRRGDIPDVVKVLDFGLVREVKADHSLSRSNINAVVGSPLYLPPEAILTPDRIDARADIYGLGCVAYFLVTGSTPFTGQTAVEVCAHHLHTPVTPPSQLRPVPEDLERVILSCLAKNAAERPQSALELSQALERCRAAGSWRASDAEAWWTATESCKSKTCEQPAISGKQLRRTICCADLERRLASQEKAI